MHVDPFHGGIYIHGLKLPFAKRRRCIFLALTECSIEQALSFSLWSKRPRRVAWLLEPKHSWTQELPPPNDRKTVSTCRNLQADVIWKWWLANPKLVNYPLGLSFFPYIHSNWVVIMGPFLSFRWKVSCREFTFSLHDDRFLCYLSYNSPVDFGEIHQREISSKNWYWACIQCRCMKSTSLLVALFNADCNRDMLLIKYLHVYLFKWQPAKRHAYSQDGAFTPGERELVFYIVSVA